MTGYLVRRSLQMLVVVFFASALIFFILNFVPGGPFSTLRASSPRITQADIERLNRLLGLDKPVHMRYIDWLKGIVTGDWGTSWSVARGVDVLKLIQSRVGNTLLLMTSSLVLSLLIAFPIGIYSAVKQYSKLDYLVTAFSFVGISMPTFWFGLMLIIIFAVTLRWLPAGSMATPGYEWDPIDRLKHLILPMVVLSLFYVAGWSRFIRSSMLEVLRQDYIRTALAKGLGRGTVIFKHALRNALIPVITVVALALPDLFAGAIITETVFAWPGMGRLYYDAVFSSDWPVAMGILVMTALLVVIANLIADIAYALVDPRIRYS